MSYVSELKIQLRRAHDIRDQAVAEATFRSQEAAQVARDAALKSQRDACEVDCLARVAFSEWGTVHLVSDLELDLVRGDRQVLSVLLTELDEMSQCL